MDKRTTNQQVFRNYLVGANIYYTVGVSVHCGFAKYSKISEGLEEKLFKTHRTPEKT